MQVKILAFATASDALGAPERQIEIAEGSTVGALKTLLGERYPQLGPLWGRIAVAVGGEVAGDEAVLTEGVEVALLPPVSGGAPTATAAPAAAGERAALVEHAIDPAPLLARVGGPTRGAVVLFLGTVRDHHQGRPVRRLGYTAYRPMALARIERIVDQLEAADRQLRVAIVHRLGTLDPGEASVAIATASPHREAAYAANRTALERLKAEVPIWKREHYADGEAAWREEESLLAAPQHQRVRPSPSQ